MSGLVTGTRLVAPGFTRPGDLSASNRYVVRDLTEPFVLGPGGTLTVPVDAGLGVTIDVDFLRACVVRSVVLCGTGVSP